MQKELLVQKLGLLWPNRFMSPKDIQAGRDMILAHRVQSLWLGSTLLDDAIDAFGEDSDTPKFTVILPTGSASASSQLIETADCCHCSVSGVCFPLNLQAIKSGRKEQLKEDLGHVMTACRMNAMRFTIAVETKYLSVDDLKLLAEVTTALNVLSYVLCYSIGEGVVNDRDVRTLRQLVGEDPSITVMGNFTVVEQAQILLMAGASSVVTPHLKSLLTTMPVSSAVPVPLIGGAQGDLV